MAMKLTEIERETIPVLTVTEVSTALADEAAEVLGYKRLKEEHAEPASPLRAELAKLQIEVLKDASVKRYQLERLKEHATEKFNEWLQRATVEDMTTINLPSWRHRKIEEYTEPIPEFVLNKAIQIKKAIPEAVILVESLEDYPDPFLIVATRNPSYTYVYKEQVYVEVWEEPKFEGTL